MRRLEPGVLLAAPSRRSLLRAGLVTGASLVLATRLPTSGLAAHAEDAPAPFVPNAFIRIDGRGAITLIMPHTEVGQGIYTSSAMLIAEELDVGLDQVKVEPAPPDLQKYMDPILFDQATGGSTSTRADWARLRSAGATARAMLVAAAAARWSVAPDACRTERGRIHHDASGRSTPFADIVAEAARLPVPTGVKLKDAADFKLIGTPAKRLDTPAKVNGAAVFGIDTKLPGMGLGTLAIAPVKGGRLVSMDEAAARRIPGVWDVVRAGEDTVAVIGEHMWAAKRGLAALDPVWDGGPNAQVTTQAIVAAMDKASQTQGVVAIREGDAPSAIETAATKLSAIYHSPFLSHSPMEPLNCTLHVQADRVDVWVGTQVPVRAQAAVAEATGLRPDQIVIHNMDMGGAFGRRLEIDSIALAAALARQVSYPVKLIWTREEDLRHDYYRPYYYDRIAAGLDPAGRIVGRTHRVTGPSLYARWAPGAFKGGLDIDAVDCAAETPYAISAALVDYVRHEPVGIDTSWWRGVGPTHNLFVIESFIDELAAAAEKDPVAFRRDMLSHNPRALAVMERAAEGAGWGTPLKPRTGRGISVQHAFGSFLACVVEAEITPEGEILLRRGTVAIDCGMRVNPDTVRAQMEGGLIFGLGTALYDEITLTGGAVDQSNFHDYRTLRMNEVPRIDVIQVDSQEDPGGVGEAATACAAPALGNAIFAATGRRLRRLPFGNGQLQGA